MPGLPAAAVASLELLEREPQRYLSIEARHRPHLERLAEHRLVTKPRLLGGIAAFELPGDSGYLQPIGLEVQRLALEQGLFIRPLGSVVYLMPPLGINDDELAQCYASLQVVLDALPL